MPQTGVVALSGVGRLPTQVYGLPEKAAAEVQAPRPRKFRSMQAAGVSVAKLFRTGGKASMTYGEAINGVLDCLRRDQRRMAAAVTSLTVGGGGQSFDLALMMPDGSGTGRADPAYDVHGLRLGQWANAVWEGWLPF